MTSVFGNLFPRRRGNSYTAVSTVDTETNQPDEDLNTNSNSKKESTSPIWGTTSLLSANLNTSRLTSIHRVFFYFILLLSGGWILSIGWWYLMALNPEVQMVLNSKCHRPLQNWDGKIFDIPVWYNAFSNRPSQYSITCLRDFEVKPNEMDMSRPLYGGPAALKAELAAIQKSSKMNLTSTDLQLRSYDTHLTSDMRKHRPVVIWGTHHKTGTFFAKKVFARICGRMNWCCIFHVTRDTTYTMNDALRIEPVSVAGHTQWQWVPEELDLSSYRFVHFTRSPLKKVVSGFNYHYEGSETWTYRTDIPWNSICQSAAALEAAVVEIPCTVAGTSAKGVVRGSTQALGEQSLKYSGYTPRDATSTKELHDSVIASFRPATGIHTPGLGSSDINKFDGAGYTGTAGECVHRVVPRQAVYDYCANVRLCVGCCIRAHALFGESDVSPLEAALNQTAATYVSLSGIPWSLASAEDAVNAKKPMNESSIDEEFAKQTLKDALVNTTRRTSESIFDNVTDGSYGQNKVDYASLSGAYGFLCGQLGTINNDLQSTLQSRPIREAVLAEAALDYYESLRMAQIVKHTKNDSRTVTIDLDWAMSNYDDAIKAILSHLRPLIPKDKETALMEDLRFYDLERSPVYAWSMSNPLVNHVTTSANHGMSSKELITFLKEDPFVSTLYRPIYEMMDIPW